VCKKFLTLLSFFVLFSSITLKAQQINWLDFERLIKKHPMMKNFDPATNRFKNTSSEILDVKDLQKQLASITQNLEKLNQEKSQLVASSLFNESSANEEATWNSLKAIENNIESLSTKKVQLEQSIQNNGYTAATTILPIIRSILRDQFNEIEKNKTDILLNKLPRYRIQPVLIGENPVKKLFENHDLASPDLKKYLEQRHSISLMFNKTDIPVLFPGELK
jgi:hypothetical protein